MKSLIRLIASKFKKPKTTSQELFKFSWTIENVTAWDCYRRIESPSFIVKELGNAAFCLAWTEKGNSQGKCSLVLHRKKRYGTPEEIKLRFRIQVSKECFPRKTDDLSFAIEGGWGWCDYIANNVILQNDAWRLLSGEVRVECTILKPKDSVNFPLGKTSEGPHHCVKSSARTRFKTRTASVRWNVEHFRSLRNGETRSVEIFLPPESSPRFLATLFQTDEVYELGTIDMSICNLRELDANPTFVACKVTIGAEGINRIVRFYKHEFDSENAYLTWKLPMHIRKHLVKDLKILQGNALPVLLEFKVEEGFEFSKIQKAESSAESPSSTINRNNQELSKIKQYFLMLLKEQKLCDVHLKTANKMIGAHKAVLCANSPVFAGMFERDTMEKATGTIQVTGVAHKTLERFLECLYTERLDSDVAEATELYVAADHYQVDFLKRECSRLLKDNLKVENVCDVLSMADRHQDEELMDAARGFVRRCKSRVLNSEGWKKLSEESPQLTNEILQWLCKN